MPRKVILLIVILFISLTGCSSDKPPENPVSSPVTIEEGSAGTIVIKVSVAPWRPYLGKIAGVETIDSVKAFVYSSEDTKIKEENLTKNESRWQASIEVPAQNNMRLALGYFDGSLVRYLGETTGVSVSGGETKEVEISVNFLGTTVTAPDSADADYEVEWMSRPFVTNYELQEDTKNDFTTAISIYTGADTTYTVSTESKITGQIYYYRARVNTEYGYGPWYSTGGDQTNVPVPPNGTIIIDVLDLPDEPETSFEINGMTFISIPAGSFQMGDLNDAGDPDEKPVHTVNLDTFFMSTTEVTQEQYESVVGRNPSNFSGDDNLPVEMVSWEDAVKFCNLLSDNAGYDRSYDESTWECDFSKNGFRLPTEAEWEYACRAGTETKYYTGNSDSDLGRAGWYVSNSSSKTHTVGQKTANAFGLYDMHGNVWEWCNDRYDADYYDTSPSADPTGPTSGSDRVLRGGNWFNNAGFCRSADRHGGYPSGTYGIVGFRMVRRPKQ